EQGRGRSQPPLAPVPPRREWRSPLRYADVPRIESLRDWVFWRLWKAVHLRTKLLVLAYLREGTRASRLTLDNWRSPEPAQRQAGRLLRDFLRFSQSQFFRMQKPDRVVDRSGQERPA